MAFLFLLSKEIKVQGCDATMLNRTTNAGYIKYPSPTVATFINEKAKCLQTKRARFVLLGSPSKAMCVGQVTPAFCFSRSK